MPDKLKYIQILASMNKKDLKINKGDELRVRVKNSHPFGPAYYHYNVECIRIAGPKKHYFSNDAGKDWLFSDDYIRNNIVDDDNNLLF